MNRRPKLRLTAPQLRELRLLAREPQSTFGRWRTRVQNKLVQMHLAQVKEVGTTSLCYITDGGKVALERATVRS